MCEILKKCSNCKLEKPIIEFNKSKTKKNGVASLCKLCHSEYRREHYLKNKDKILTQVNTWKHENLSDDKLFKKYGDKIFLDGFNAKAGRVCETNCYYCNNRISRHKNDIDKDIKFICSVCKNDFKISFIKTQFQKVKKRALKKGLDFNLTFDGLFDKYKDINFKCEITNVEFSFNDEKNIDQPSLDRINSNKGYTFDNIRVVSLGYNYMKNTFNELDVINFINKIKK